MQAKVKFLVGLIILIIIVGGASIFYTLTGREPAEQPPIADTVPEASKSFTFFNAAEEEVNINDFKGRPTVVFLWAAWCGYCKEQMPYMVDIYQKEGEGINFIFLNAGEAPATAKAYMAESGYNVPFYLDMQNQFSKAYGLRGIPVTFFYNSQMEVVSRHLGMITQNGVKEELTKIKGL